MVTSQTGQENGKNRIGRELLDVDMQIDKFQQTKCFDIEIYSDLPETEKKLRLHVVIS